MQSLTFITFEMSEKFATLKFLPRPKTQPAGLTRAIYTTARAGSTLSLARTGAFTAQIWTKLESEVSCHHRSKNVIFLLYFQTKALCSRQQMTYNGMRATLSPTLEPSPARLASVPRRPSLNALSSAHPGFFCQCKWPHYRGRLFSFEPKISKTFMENVSVICVQLL